jgi:hypothetical protein
MLCLLPATCWFSFWLALGPWRWKWYVTVVDFHWATWCYIVEDRTLHGRHHENLRSNLSSVSDYKLNDQGLIPYWWEDLFLTMSRLDMGHPSSHVLGTSVSSECVCVKYLTHEIGMHFHIVLGLRMCRAVTPLIHAWFMFWCVGLGTALPLPFPIVGSFNMKFLHFCLSRSSSEII